MLWQGGGGLSKPTDNACVYYWCDVLKYLCCI